MTLAASQRPLFSVANFRYRPVAVLRLIRKRTPKICNLNRAALAPDELASLKKDAKKWKGTKAELGEKYGLSHASVYRLIEAS